MKNGQRVDGDEEVSSGEGRGDKVRKLEVWAYSGGDECACSHGLP